MDCRAALSAPPRVDQGNPPQCSPDRGEIVPSLGPHRLSGSLHKSCDGYCYSFSLEPLAREFKNPGGGDKIHLCMHY